MQNKKLSVGGGGGGGMDIFWNCTICIYCWSGRAILPAALFIRSKKTVLIFESMDKILKCNHLNECY